MNKPHALITFVESLCDVRYASKVPKKVFLNKYKNQLDINLKQLRQYHHKISRTAIYNHSKTKNLLEALYIESLKSENLKGLESRINKYRTSINKALLTEYFINLKKLMPLYEKSIWDNSFNNLLTKKRQIEALMRTHNYDNLIKKIAYFYGVKAKDIGTIDIAFYPISFGNNINAYRIKNLETIGILVNKNQNLKWLLSATILHEISHTLYFKSKIVNENFTFNNIAKQTTIIEGFATAIGAGWGYKTLNGQTSKGKWYNNNEYDKLAKQIYSDINIYLNNHLQMDAKLIKKIKNYYKIPE